MIFFTDEPRAAAPPAVHVGIVRGAGGINFMAAAETRGALMRRLARYARSRADMQLYDEDARTLGRLVSAGSAEAAVRFYFERVGERWDREWLDEGTVPVAREEAGGS